MIGTKTQVHDWRDHGMGKMASFKGVVVQRLVTIYLQRHAFMRLCIAKDHQCTCPIKLLALHLNCYIEVY